jgi:hypothetical protein
MHDGWEELRKRSEFSSIISELGKELTQGGEIFVIVISLNSCIFNFFFQLSKRICVGTLASFKEAEDSLDIN